MARPPVLGRIPTATGSVTSISDASSGLTWMATSRQSGGSVAVVREHIPGMFPADDQ
jgi:hypothetical protein